MNKLKVIEPIFGLEIGDELIYNEDTKTYDFKCTNEEISENITTKDSRSISLSKMMVEWNLPFFEETTLPNYDDRLADMAGTYELIKPICIKAYDIIKDGVVIFDGKEYDMKVGDKIIECFDKTHIPISKKIFDKLFKIIK